MPAVIKGLTVIVKLIGVPTQAPDTGVTVIVATIGDPVLFIAVKGKMFPVPFEPRPMEGSLFVQL